MDNCGCIKHGKEGSFGVNVLKMRRQMGRKVNRERKMHRRTVKMTRLIDWSHRCDPPCGSALTHAESN